MGSSSGIPPYLWRSFNNIPAIKISSDHAIHGNKISNRSMGIIMYVMHNTATILTHRGDLWNCAI